jgi:hypothetical protein
MPLFNVGFVIFPDLTQLDFTGPQQVLARLPESAMHIVAKSAAAVPPQGAPRNHTLGFHRVAAARWRDIRERARGQRRKSDYRRRRHFRDRLWLPRSGRDSWRAGRSSYPAGSRIRSPAAICFWPSRSSIGDREEHGVPAVRNSQGQLPRRTLAVTGSVTKGSPPAVP